jgi:hypothetical protein
MLTAIGGCTSRYHCGVVNKCVGCVNTTCDNCHPSVYGYNVLAATVKAAITAATATTLPSS